MAILNPDHLFEQAERLAAPPTRGRPRQVDLRRAVSAAYYGLFHFTLTQMADLLIGSSQRSSALYALVYRTVSHQYLVELCLEVGKTTASPKFRSYLPAPGLGSELKDFAAAVTELQERRHDADYDPAERFGATDVEAAVAAARAGRTRFLAASSDDQRNFLTLLAFRPRLPA